MIEFQRVKPAQKQQYEKILFSCPPRGCEYSFTNLCVWGLQQVAFLHDCVAFFSHFGGKSLYPYPIGNGDRRAVLEEIIQDSRERGIPCRISGMTEQDRRELEAWFPGKFHIASRRDGFDYVYTIDDLADLRGRKFQKKRNHVNRFRIEHPEYTVQPLTAENQEMAQNMVNDWYVTRLRSDPEGDYLLENIAITRAFQNWQSLGMDGLLLMDGEEVLAVTMASRMSGDTLDIHFEKAREDVDGAYTAVNQEFARHLRLKYPEIVYLNREDDMGLEGLRKAKLSYNPHHMEEKYYATFLEDIHGAG